MIDYLKGNLELIEQDYVVIDVGGVGYRVFCPNPLTYSSQLNQYTQLYIHYHVREDANLLYGFATREEQSLFRLLLEVSGIGPKVALGILTGGSPETVVIAIAQENIHELTQLPGIGKKTAQRIILDLKDKVSSFSMTGTSSSPVKNIGASSASSQQTNWLDAKEALLAWGYTEAEMQKVRTLLKDQIDEHTPVDSLIKLALKVLQKS